MLRITLIASLFVLISCDRHEWEGEEGTARLFPKPHAAHGSHGDDHGQKDDKAHKSDKKDEAHH